MLIIHHGPQVECVLILGNTDPVLRVARRRQVYTDSGPLKIRVQHHGPVSNAREFTTWSLDRFRISAVWAEEAGRLHTFLPCFPYVPKREVIAARLVVFVGMS